MKQSQFSIDINASKEKVWDTLWDDATYPVWTSVFDPGSRAVSNWEEGDKITFLSSLGGGMYSVIERKDPYRFMSFKHLGEVKDGKELPIDDKTKLWSGSMENYTLEDHGGSVTVRVDLDTPESEAEYFKDKFPIALQKLKEISER